MSTPAADSRSLSDAVAIALTSCPRRSRASASPRNGVTLPPPSHMTSRNDDIRPACQCCADDAPVVGRLSKMVSTTYLRLNGSFSPLEAHWPGSQLTPVAALLSSNVPCTG